MAYGALVERTVPVPRATIYALLADFGGIGKLMGDAVESCTLEGTAASARSAASARAACRASWSSDSRPRCPGS